MRRTGAEILICMMLITVCLLVFGQIRGFTYINYDDFVSISDDAYFNKGLSLGNVSRAFLDPIEHLPYQSPVSALYRMLQWEMAGDDFGVHHLFSLFVHIATVILFFVFLRCSTDALWTSGLCALLFAVHPLNVEPVCWLSGFSGLLEGFFFIMALLGYYYYARKPGVKRYLLIFPPFMLGLMCKPTIAVLPFLMLLLDYWPLKRFDCSRCATGAFLHGHYKIVLEKLPFLVLAPVQLVVGEMLIKGQLSGAPSLPSGFHAGAIVDMALFSRKIVYPAGLAICRPYPPDAALTSALAVVFILVMVSCLIIWKMRACPSVFTGWFWCLTSLLPVVILITLSGRPVADRHYYIPLMGLLMAFAFGVARLRERFQPGWTIIFSCALVIPVLLGAMSFAQAAHWKNSITVFTHAVSVYPESKRARANLGDAFFLQGDIIQAVRHYRELVRIAPESAAAHTKLANALARNNMGKEAEYHFWRAIVLAPGYAFGHHSLADYWMDNGRLEKAIHHYRLALAINPNLFQTHNSLAAALMESGDKTGAAFHLERALQINPGYETARNNLDRLCNSPGMTDPRHAE